MFDGRDCCKWPIDDPAMRRCKLLTAAQVAELLGVHIATVWRLMQRVENPLPCVRFGERITRFPLAGVEKWLQQIGAGPTRQ